MCGRFSLRARAAAMLAEYFDIIDAPLLEARYNIAPSQPVPVVRLTSGPPDPKRELVLMRWGLIPSWAKDAKIGNRMINARAETLVEKPVFRGALQRRRCLIAADGFYEWQGTSKSKQPYFIRFRDDRPFAFAGLWDNWEGSNHSVVESCTIITTEANELVRPIHDRMPVILPPETYKKWLDPGFQRIDELTSLLVPFVSDEMEAYCVSTIVGSPAHNDPRCVEPMENIPNQARDLF
jgi:putative SOS response-associated peptidase YedK